MFRVVASIAALMLIVVSGNAHSAQVADKNFHPKAQNPAFKSDAGPVVAVDAAHANFHTCDGRYIAFCELMRSDGYKVHSNKEKFTTENLKKIDLLVIANALSEKNIDPKQNWATPILPAFSQRETENLVAWVNEGGSLLLIADHMPFPGAVSDLALKFGVNWGNNYAFAADTQIVEAARENTLSVITGPDANMMTFDVKGLNQTGVKAYPNPVFRGRNETENVPFVTTFTGSTFTLLPGSKVVPLMALGEGTLLMYPLKSQEQSLSTPRGPGAGTLQGGVLRFGKGRVAIIAEASWCSAQIADYISPGFKMGMNNTKSAPYNVQFALNLVHWLTGLID